MPNDWDVVGQKKSTGGWDVASQKPIVPPKPTPTVAHSMLGGGLGAGIGYALGGPAGAAKGVAIADDASRQILSGLTFGFGDNLEAALYSLPSWLGGDKRGNETMGQAYDRNLAEIRGSMGNFQKESPKTAFALEMAGAAAPAFLTGGAATAGSTGARLLPRVAKGAAIGAIYGGLGNAGASNAATLEDTAKAGLKGAAFGALTGGAMPVISEGLRRVAGNVADSALGIRMNDRRYGKTPAEAILDETSGLTPSKIEESARQQMSNLQGQLRAASQNKVADIGAAQALAQRSAAEASRGINQPLAGELREMADALVNAPANFYGNRSFRGAQSSISPRQNAPDLPRLKREFSDRFLNWNSTTSDPAKAVGKQIYGALDNAFDTAVPEAASLNQRISSLIPVAQRAESKQLQAGALQRGLGRFAAHTGALTGGGLGLYYGGPLGGLAGVMIPELIASPSAQMGAARAMNLPSKSPAEVENLFRYMLSQGIRLTSPEDKNR